MTGTKKSANFGEKWYSPPLRSVTIYSYSHRFHLDVPGSDELLKKCDHI